MDISHYKLQNGVGIIQKIVLIHFERHTHEENNSRLSRTPLPDTDGI